MNPHTASTVDTITHSATPYFKTVCSSFPRPHQSPPPARLISPTASRTQHGPVMANPRYACCTRNFLPPAHRPSLPRNYISVLDREREILSESHQSFFMVASSSVMLGQCTRYMADRGGRRLDLNRPSRTEINRSIDPSVGGILTERGFLW